MLKKIINKLLYFIGITCIATFIITILNYFNILNDNTINILKILIPIIIISISSFQLGKTATKKGYIEGIKFGLIIISIFIIITIILKEISIKSIIYYLILLLTSTLSSMLGINQKKS